MKNLLLLLFCFTAVTLNAQVYTHSFEGATAGEDLESLEDWFVTTKDGYNGGASPIFSDQDVLFYSGYIGSEAGISIEIDSANGGVGGDATRRYTSGWNVMGDDTLKFDASQTYTAEGIYYAAFLVKPLGPDYGGMRDIFQFEMSPSLGNWSRARVFMDISGDTDVQFGIGKKNGPVEDGTDTTATFVNGVGDTYLLVLAYEQMPGEDNDVVKLYVNPDPSMSAAEQTMVIASPDLANDYNSGSGVLPLRVNIAQRGHTAEIGCIRVGTDWTAVLQGPAVTGVSLDQATLSLDVGADATLVATVMPQDAGDPSVSWSTSDAAVATVADGVVTGVAAGTATITVTTTDGSFTDECVVTVSDPTGISELAAAELSIYPNPSNGAFTIGNSEGADVVIFNAIGSVVFRQSNIDHNELISTDLSKGMYYVSVTKDNDQRVAKLIIK